MKFGVREICDVVLKAKANQKVGNKIFYKGEPVIYFDTLKTSSLEGAATTVYAQGGRGNSRLVAWEGERTVTFTMEDALISPAGFMILSGAGLIEASDDTPIYVHTTEVTDHFIVDDSTNATPIMYVALQDKPHIDSKQDTIYVMLQDEDGEIISEPYIPDGTAEKIVVTKTTSTVSGSTTTTTPGTIKLGSSTTEIGKDSTETADAAKKKIYDAFKGCHGQYMIKVLPRVPADATGGNALNGRDGHYYTAKESGGKDNTKAFDNTTAVLVDYYVEKKSGAQQIDITPDKFGGNYYLEASTLFRTQKGIDLPAEFIIPNCKIQSNFTFTMASSGDPSSFTFTMDAFPDVTRFDSTKKVLAAIQIIDAADSANALRRASTPADDSQYFSDDANATYWINEDSTTPGKPAKHATDGDGNYGIASGS